MLRERRRGEPVPAATEDECGSIELRRLSGQVHGLSGVEILNNRLRAAGAKLVHPEADRMTGRRRSEQELLRRPEEEHPPKGSGKIREQAFPGAVDPRKLRARSEERRVGKECG